MSESTSPTAGSAVDSSVDFAARRAAAFQALGDGVLVLPAAPIRFRSRDTEYPYRPDSELYYLTGLAEPGSVAVLLGGDDPRFVLFVRDRDPAAELWSGPRLGPEAAAELFGADVAYSSAELSARLPGLLQQGDRIHVRLSGSGPVQDLVQAALQTARARGARLGSGPRGVVDPGEILDPLRMRKAAREIALIRRACSVSVLGHRAAMAVARPGIGEWMVEADVNAAFRRAGAAGSGFDTIVGSGPNACVLHYVANHRTIEDGDLVLVDAGAEVALYNGDITRTLPASGGFTETQRTVYDLVDGARMAAIAAVRPGARLGDVHTAAVSALVEGLVALGVLDGDPSEIAASGGYRDFFPHQTSHWLGLDVHDPGDYAKDGSSTLLEAGMVFTVEPGLYFRPGFSGGEAFEGIGVRIEDDILVTEDGCENLTEELPTAADEIEALVRAGA
jgi:Xaa-Pro aminopeptidase